MSTWLLWCGSIWVSQAMAWQSFVRSWHLATGSKTGRSDQDLALEGISMIEVNALARRADAIYL